MCQICHLNPCAAQCPNAPEPAAISVCEICGEPIILGDTYAAFDGADYCGTCIWNMTSNEIVSLFGGEWKIAVEGGN